MVKANSKGSFCILTGLRDRRGLFASSAQLSIRTPYWAGGADCHFCSGAEGVRSHFPEESGPKWLPLKIFQTVQRDAAARLLLTWMEGMQWTHCVGDVNPARWNSWKIPFLHQTPHPAGEKVPSASLRSHPHWEGGCLAPCRNSIQKQRNHVSFVKLLTRK